MQQQGHGSMPEARMKISLSPDLKDAALEMLPASGMQGEVRLNLDQIGTLITRLGQARATMVAKTTPPAFEGVPINPVYGTRWAVQPEALTEGSVLAFQHPAYGPVAFALPPADVEKLVRSLTAHLGMVHTSKEGGSKPS